MQTKTAKVRAAIAHCDNWYEQRNRNIRTLTERIEAMWFEVEYHADRLELAERLGETEAVNSHLKRITSYLIRIQAEAKNV